MRGFHDDLADVKDIPVATVATGIVTPEGQTCILILNEALYFGETMDHTLINPNQIRNYGVNVSDNPFDFDKPFGIDHEDVFVPFMSSGTTVYFDSFYPTDEQLDNERFVTLTSEEDWNPTGVDISCNRSQGVYSVTVNEVSRENQRRASIAVEPESDMVLRSVCGSLVQGDLLERMIATVKMQP